MNGSIRWLFAVGLLAAACAPARAPAASPATGSVPAASAPERALVVGNDADINGFGEMFAGGKSGPEQLEVMIHRSLAELDDQGKHIPGVAAALPSQADGTWNVLPDGRAETIWKLRPNARWHDGTPLTAEDVIFSWRVYLAPDVPYKQRRAATQIEDMEAVDAHTVSMRWKSLFVGAGRLTVRDIFLLPRHRLEETFLNDRTGFVNSSFWTTAFVGLGPYRVMEWEPGTHVQIEAFDGFYGERPRIKTITFKTIPDINTALARIMAGEVDVWLGSSLGVEHAQLLKAQWESRGGGQVIAYPRLIFEIRFAPGDPKVADLRMRKALYHGLDRESIVRDKYDSLLEVAHSYVAPGTSGFDVIDARTTKYRYDLGRAQELLAELGWRKGADGLLRNDVNEGFLLPFSTTIGNPERESVQAVVGDMWKALGFDVRFQNVPLSMSANPEYQFATTDLSGISSDFESNIPRIDSRNLKGPQNPRGANVWGYANAEVDRLLDEWLRTTDRPRQIEIEAVVVHRLSEDLPILPINYRIEAITATKGLIGVPKRTSGPSSNNSWNVETWRRS